MMNNNNEDHESFLGYKPPIDEVPNPPRSDEIIQVRFFFLLAQKKVITK